MHGQRKTVQTFFHWCIEKTLEIEENLFKKATLKIILILLTIHF